ncbi:MAG TPA: undecaprenyldiphospho-muramoylpentapeptide beta-N-acetylglucosaminyltransferase [Crocinitomicaceae bacterium]|nr:undecaprenyldiphospho-muramoylpentapeptide beta-N-acetylglucosaminyltransferase [Crocinitomicaceae bacterium]
MSIERIIISGGGSGGHIFPAVAIANEVKRRYPNAKILFIGAKGKMEMEKVPEAGYEIIGLPISGLQRKLTWSNFVLPFKLIASFLKAISIVKKVNPQIVVGVGGYASAAAMYAGSFCKKPVLIQEQNNFPGKTNKTMAKKAAIFCTAYDGLDTYFDKNKIVLTGNPVRSEMVDIDGKRDEAITFFNLDPNKKTVLVVGGSLGARTLNESVAEKLDFFENSDIQVIWQCGKASFQKMQAVVAEKQPKNVHLHEFIKRMDLAYSVADVIISRAGAIAISELCIIGKPTILVPSPFVAEDHQTKNAMALVAKNAAILVKDVEAKEKLVDTVFALVEDNTLQNTLKQNITALAKPHATASIVDEIEKLINK